LAHCVPNRWDRFSNKVQNYSPVPVVHGKLDFILFFLIYSETTAGRRGIFVEYFGSIHHREYSISDIKDIKTYFFQSVASFSDRILN